MIILVHLLFAAAIGHVIKNMPLAVILAFLSHYFLDLLPHTEYNIDKIEKKQWKSALPQFAMVLLDFFLGILLILIFSDNQPIIYVCALVTMLPDGLTFLNHLFPNKILEAHAGLHRGRVHFFRHKKISDFWRIASQIAIVFASIALFSI